MAVAVGGDVKEYRAERRRGQAGTGRHQPDQSASVRLLAPPEVVRLFTAMIVWQPADGAHHDSS